MRVPRKGKKIISEKTKTIGNKHKKGSFWSASKAEKSQEFILAELKIYQGNQQAKFKIY